MDAKTDPSQSDIDLWISPSRDDLDKETAKLIMLRSSDEFCDMVKRELDVLSDYKAKVGDAVIWKRLQPKVREMCDVCSTSLFNLHFTCDDCGIIVCIDCHDTRINRTLHYQGSGINHNYKSRKRLIRNDLDSHFWPFCKGQGKEHTPERMILTQIICGNILQEMSDKVHDLKKRMGMKRDCQCCKPPSPVKEAKKDAIEKSKAKGSVVKSEKKAISHPEPKSSFVEQLTECPVCKQAFRNSKDRPLSSGIHLLQHFSKDLSKDLPDQEPFTCPECEGNRSDLTTLMLHFGLDHGQFELKIQEYERNLYSIKNIVLKVDTQER